MPCFRRNFSIKKYLDPSILIEVPGVLYFIYTAKLGGGDIEDVAWYDDFIQHVLEDINGETPLDELIGFREGGRILVFNKSHASGNS